MGLNIQLNRKQYAKTRRDFTNTTSMDLRFGFWGMVTAVNPEECSVDVIMDNGMELANVRVASMEWVTMGDDGYLTGERHLPPVDTYVFCVMPNGEYSSAFVLCSGFSKHEAVHDNFKEEGEDAQNTWDKIENTDWRVRKDYRTGTIKLQNKSVDDDATIVLEINQEDEGDEKVNLTVHGTNIEITKDDGVKITSDKAIAISSDETIDLSSNDKQKLLLGNGEGSLGDMISNLIQYVHDLETYGSPAAHTVSPSSQSDLENLKTQWEKVFEK